MYCQLCLIKINLIHPSIWQKPKVQYIPMGDGHIGSWEHQVGVRKEEKSRLLWLNWLHFERKEIPFWTLSELWSIYLVAMEMTYQNDQMSLPTGQMDQANLTPRLPGAKKNDLLHNQSPSII